jgi:hypothetical protein
MADVEAEIGNAHRSASWPDNTVQALLEIWGLCKTGQLQVVQWCLQYLLRHCDASCRIHASLVVERHGAGLTKLDPITYRATHVLSQPSFEAQFPALPAWRTKAVIVADSTHQSHISTRISSIMASETA